MAKLATRLNTPELPACHFSFEMPIAACCAVIENLRQKAFVELLSRGSPSGKLAIGLGSAVRSQFVIRLKCLYAECCNDSAWISTRSTSQPAASTFLTAELIAASNDVASRWKSTEKTPLHVPGVPSSQPHSNNLSAISSVNSIEPFKIKLNSYLCIFATFPR